MTEKRFKYTFEGIEDTLESDEEYKYTLCNKDGFQDLCVMLNELNDKNEQLKSENNRLVNETAKIVAEHQRKVLDLIDEKIDELEERYKFGQEVYQGCPMHNIRFGINTLKELKKELEE